MRSLFPDPTALPADRVLRTARSLDWRGRDPYDTLASPLGQAVIPLGSLARYTLTQAALRVEWVRTVTTAPPLLNPKAVALFLGAVVRGGNLGSDARDLVRLLHDARSVGGGWGYPFPWQSRYFWAPAGTANAVVTATVGWMCFEAWRRFSVPGAEALARESREQITTRLQWTRVGDGAAVSYTPGDRTRVVNISALAARVLARSGDAGAMARASDLISFVLATQRPDGSWPYALDAGAQWEDSFHTGYVLEALLDVSRDGVPVPPQALARGFESYRRFFDDDGGARLRPDEAVYDAHSAAQGIVTYLRLADSDHAEIALRERAAARAADIARWTLANLYLPDEGYFAYRLAKGRRDERNFLRWVQAWMALALAALQAHETSGTASDSVPEERRATS